MASFASSATMGGARKHAWTKRKILQGLRVAQAAVKSRKTAEKLPFFLKKIKFTPKKYFFFAFIL